MTILNVDSKTQVRLSVKPKGRSLDTLKRTYRRKMNREQQLILNFVEKLESVGKNKSVVRKLCTRFGVKTRWWHSTKQLRIKLLQKIK